VALRLVFKDTDTAGLQLVVDGATVGWADMTLSQRLQCLRNKFNSTTTRQMWKTALLTLEPSAPDIKPSRWFDESGVMARKAGEDNNESSPKQRWLAKLDHAVLYELQMRPKYIDKDLTAFNLASWCKMPMRSIHQLKHLHHQLTCQNAAGRRRDDVGSRRRPPAQDAHHSDRGREWAHSHDRDAPYKRRARSNDGGGGDKGGGGKGAKTRRMGGDYASGSSRQDSKYGPNFKAGARGGGSDNLAS
jgi:hypothetical protein